MIEVVEDRELHVGVDAMDECNPAVREVEQHGVLVLDTVGTQQSAAVGIEVESLTVVDQQVGADPPRLVGIGREIGVGHHDVVTAGIPDDLDPRVLEAVDAMVTGAGEDVGELVRHAIVRPEDRDVGHVVQESRARTVVEPIRVAHRSREQMEVTVVMEQSGVEDRPVPRQRARRHDRLGRHTTNRLGRS